MIGVNLRKLTTLMARVARRSRYEIAKRIMPSTAVLGPKIVPLIAGPLIEKQELKLNLGCGPMHLDGYVNLDANPTACADFYIDFTQLDKVFSASIASEILMIHSLSYLNLWQARNFFRVAHRVLKPGGKLVIELPSLEKCSKHLLDSQGDLPTYLEGVRGVFAFDLSEITNQVDFTPYSFGWSAWHLEKELREASFSEIVVTAPKFHGQPWRDIRVEATKPQ